MKEIFLEIEYVLVFSMKKSEVVSDWKNLEKVIMNWVIEQK